MAEKLTKKDIENATKLAKALEDVTKAFKNVTLGSKDFGKASKNSSNRIRIKENNKSS